MNSIADWVALGKLLPLCVHNVLAILTYLFRSLGNNSYRSCLSAVCMLGVL